MFFRLVFKLLISITAIVAAVLLIIAKFSVRIAIWLLLIWYIAIPIIELILPIEGLRDSIIQYIHSLQS